jgi:hypothetical protein
MTEQLSDRALAEDRRFFDALLAGDPVELDRVLGAEFLIVDVAAGGVTNRVDFLAAVAGRMVRFVEIETFPAEAVVREFGDTVVVVGRTAMAVSMPGQGLVRAASRYTHVFVVDQGDWRLVSAQGTPIA